MTAPLAKIAIIDDNEDEIIISRHKFRLARVNVPLAHHLSLAHLKADLAEGRAECPDILIIDMHMPTQPGTEVLVETKKLGTLSGVRRGICTGSRDPADEAAALAAGAEFYLTKPLDAEALSTLCAQLDGFELVADEEGTRLCRVDLAAAS